MHLAKSTCQYEKKEMKKKLKIAKNNNKEFQKLMFS